MIRALTVYPCHISIEYLRRRCKIRIIAKYDKGKLKKKKEDHTNRIACNQNNSPPWTKWEPQIYFNFRNMFLNLRSIFLSQTRVWGDGMLTRCKLRSLVSSVCDSVDTKSLGPYLFLLTLLIIWPVGGAKNWSISPPVQKGTLNSSSTESYTIVKISIEQSVYLGSNKFNCPSNL